jgi:hypothetical protein
LFFDGFGLIMHLLCPPPPRPRPGYSEDPVVRSDIKINLKRVFFVSELFSQIARVSPD